MSIGLPLTRREDQRFLTGRGRYAENTAPIDGAARTDGNCSERELRGGSWFTTPAYVRADYRNHFAVGYRTSSVGIRLVREINK